MTESNLHVHIISRAKAKELGMKRYFTGKPCKRGGIGDRLVSSKECKCGECTSGKKRYGDENRKEILEKKKKYREENKDKVAERQIKYREENRDKLAEKNRKYREDNREKVAEKDRRYYEKNNDKIAERKRKYREDNKEKAAERHRKYWAENKEKIDEYQRKYREDNKDKIAERKRKYREENPHIRLANTSRRRAAKIQRVLVNDCELTHLVEREAFDLCMERSEAMGGEWHVDHMLPLQGRKVSGFHHWSNLQVIPARLNLSKHNRMIYTEPFEWLKDA